MTRDLSPDVPFCDSDIPWLDEIPAHWTITRLKFVAEVQSGLTLGKNYGTVALVEYPYLRVANVQDGHLDPLTLQLLWFLRLKQNRAF